MGADKIQKRAFRCLSNAPVSLLRGLNRKGQALVEFTLVFMLLLVVAWIPADFGLAMYTGQLAQNASREGARIAAADPGVAAQVGSCSLPTCYSLDPNSVLYRTATRISSALLPGAQVELTLDGGTGCNRQVTVRVSGTYNYFFYGFLRWFGVGGNLNTVNIVRQSRMRWEHQC
ncbi:MAG TPA: TadE/TadG family type IV pilus assembly protein [Candidatus Binatia bacterium]|nr:TadE/TadG family type IV pilus assembly protein [Candidatus Binatia bacterium]